MVRIILDPGAESSYISKNLVKALKSDPFDSVTLSTFTIGGKVSQLEKLPLHHLKLRSRFDSNSSIGIQCLEVAEITKGYFPHYTNNLGKERIADAAAEGASPSVEILIGSDFLRQVMVNMELEDSQLIAYETIFGWFFHGKNEDNSASEHFDTAFCALLTAQPATHIIPLLPASRIVNNKSPVEDINFLWELENIGIGYPKNDEESLSSQELSVFVENSIKRLPSGRYQVSLPFKDNLRTLGDNRDMALSRLKSFLTSSKKDARLIQAVDEEFSVYLEKGFIEPAKERNPNELAHYLPLVAVAKKSLSPGDFKIRVVKDAGARRRDEASLNDVLHQGPNLLPDIVDILCCFRKHSVIIVTDIEKAFQQFKIDPLHRTFLRFFWPLGVSKNPKAKIIEFWATSLDFGLICSPWLHCAGLKFHLDKEIENHPQHSKFLEEIKNHFYMDDIVAGAASVPDGINKCKLLDSVFKAGGFPLTKWATSSRNVGEFLKAFFKEQEVKVTFDDPGFKFLGLLWNQQEDRIGVSTDKAIAQLASSPAIKRTLLKGLAQIFDPLGILGPITINAKKLLQKLWSTKIDWDTLLEGDESEDFHAFHLSLRLAKKCQIDRLMCAPLQDAPIFELHVFSDASLAAYGCVIYLRESRADNEFKTSFLMAKARVTPLKGDWNIHRLELMAAILAARLAKKVKIFLELKLHLVRYWCDNASVLGWIRDKPIKRKAFVANRVKEIQSLSAPEDWSYVRSEENPADLISRGILLSSTDNISFWKHGPSWLKNLGHPEFSHNLDTTMDSEDALAENRIDHFLSVEQCFMTSSAVQADNFSSWNKLVRVWAYVFRFINKCRKFRGPPRIGSTISYSEFLNASESIFKDVQRKHFASELASGCQHISKQSILYQLSPFIDDSGLIRCRSRLEKSELLGYNAVYPIILPSNDKLFELFVSNIHSSICLHSGGVTAVLHNIRKSHLILHARRLAKKIVSSCRKCRRFVAKPAIETIPPLPAFRIETAAPFISTGVDFAGPIYCKMDQGQKSKCYIVLFVCAVTRAIYLDLVPNLTTFEFLLVFRRFRNRYPSVTTVFSDNGKTFVRAAKELNYFFSSFRSTEFQSSVAELRIHWEFITEHSPWHGGWWERLVQTVKRPLRKLLGTNVPQFRELQATLSDIELMVNKRPLTAVSCDSNEICALSPADILYGFKSEDTLPQNKKIASSSENADALVFSDRWRKQQNIISAFWKRFNKE